jgi:DNA polymerase elongation subunit (family B)
MVEAHYLKPNHRCEMPSRLILVDTEAWMDQDVQTLRLGHAVLLVNNRGKWSMNEFAFKTQDEFHSWLDKVVASKNKVRNWMMAHNMPYDWAILGMDRYFSQDGWEAPHPFVLKPFIFGSRKGEVSIDVISTTNLYQESLKSLGKRLGVEKIDMSEEQMMKASDEELAIYCRQDVMVLVELLKTHIKFLLDNDLGSFKATQALQAMAAYRHRFMGDTKLLVHHFPTLEALEGESYRGGRVEMFRKGRFEDTFYVDVNSMYPFVMKENVYPTVPRGKAPRKVPAAFSLDKAMEDSFVIARCLLDLKQPCISVHRGDMLLNPVGHVNAVITSSEIEYIRNHPECGSIKRPVEVMAYEQANIFCDFVDFFYEMKKNAPDEPSRHRAKIFLNALYGKFAQRYNSPITEVTDDVTRNAIIAAMDDLDTDSMNEAYPGPSYIRTGGRLMMTTKTKGEYASESMVRLSSAVTAYARMELQRLIDLAGPSQVLYVDTDGLYITRKGFEAVEQAGLLDERKLGMLKSGGPYDFTPYGLKDYAVDGVRKTKGISKNAIQIAPDTFQQKQFQTGKSRYNDGIRDGVRVTTVTKVISGNYRKGTVTQNGKVLPFHLSEW